MSYDPDRYGRGAELPLVGIFGDAGDSVEIQVHSGTPAVTAPRVGSQTVRPSDAYGRGSDDPLVFAQRTLS